MVSATKGGATTVLIPGRQMIHSYIKITDSTTEDLKSFNQAVNMFSFTVK